MGLNCRRNISWNLFPCIRKMCQNSCVTMVTWISCVILLGSSSGNAAATAPGPGELSNEIASALNGPKSSTGRLVIAGYPGGQPTIMDSEYISNSIPPKHPWRRDSYTDAANDLGYGGYVTPSASTSEYGQNYYHDGNVVTEYDSSGSNQGGLGGLAGLAGLVGLLGLKGIKGIGILGVLKALGLPLLLLLGLPILLILPLLLLLIPVPVITVPTQGRRIQGDPFANLAEKISELTTRILEKQNCHEKTNVASKTGSSNKIKESKTVNKI